MVDKVNTDELGKDEFNLYHYESGKKRPVLIKDEVADWEATRKWCPEYLDCMLGHQEVNVMFLEDGIYNVNNPEKWEEKKLPFSEARRYICEDGRYYLAQATIEVPLLTRIIMGTSGDFPRLAEDIQEPRYLDDYSKRLHVTNLWFGGDQCKTPLHYDNKENFFLQIFGEKRILLFSPSQTDYLYQAHGEEHDHLSRINVFDPDESKFPRYEDAECAEIIVEPGDMLFIPEGWWHAVETLTTSISINFWWTGPVEYVSHELRLLSDRFDNLTP